MSRRRCDRAGTSGYPRINSSMRPSPGVVEGRPTLRLVEACEENHVAPPETRKHVRGRGSGVSGKRNGGDRGSSLSKDQPFKVVKAMRL